MTQEPPPNLTQEEIQLLWERRFLTAYHQADPQVQAATRRVLGIPESDYQRAKHIDGLVHDKDQD